MEGEKRRVMTEGKVKHYFDECIEQNKLGFGTFGTVYKGRHFEDTSRIVAIKWIDRSKGPARTTAREILDRELDILKGLSSTPHVNVISLLDYEKIPPSIVFLVTEFCNGGDFREYLIKETFLKESVIRPFFRQIGNGLNFLHEKNIVHRDMKPENILLCFDGGPYPAPEVIVLKIADFGIGRILSPDGTAETICGSLNYMAPEIVPKQQYDEKVDMWSIGAIMFECLVGTSKAQELGKLGKLEFPENGSSDLKNLLENLLIHDPNNRFSCDQFLKHPFICETMNEKCDQCEENDGETAEAPSATVFCIDCKENQCSECNRGHNRQKLFKAHRVIPIGEKPTSVISKSSIKTKQNKFTRKSCADINRSIVHSLKFFVADEKYSTIQKIIPNPCIKEEDLPNIWQIALPYIIQRIKMWNGNVVKPENLASLVTPSINRAHSSISSVGSKALNGKQSLSEISRKDPVSRLDCLTYIINTGDFTVTQDILRILSKFPVAIPLIVQDISDNDKYIVTIPLIQNVEIKWESTPGQIAENYLFTSPFRMITAIRLGNNKIGKSTILNQLMKKQYVFSSCCEAGSQYGRPRTLDGSVEMVWLTQETCNDSMWKSVMRVYYKGNMEEVAILANVHGDVLQFEDTLKYLIELSCSFIVFLMPGFNQEEWSKLKQLLSQTMSVHILVDPKPETEDFDFSSINTSLLVNDNTQEILRRLLQEILTMKLNMKSSSSKLSLEMELPNSLQSPIPFKNENCQKIVEMARKHGCYSVRQLLDRVEIEQPSKWDQQLTDLIKRFISTVNCPEKRAKQSLVYLETKLSQLTSKESESARLQVREANEKVRRIVKAPLKDNTNENTRETNSDRELKEAQDKLKLAMHKVNNINLGQEHFFRVLGRLFELSQTTSSLQELYRIQTMLNYMADLLIEGHAIELLNGDSGEIQILWMKAICDSVSKKTPNFRVFVISIIGLQSSGKSTLLNALFSCRFAVSVGRCSRGLYMRMIMLEDDLRETHQCDAIVLIDTEGLCSSEKMNDLKASHNDRLMATYALGVSDLTIVNILGEGITEMTEILQIAIVAMARLRGGGIRPDLLMVQHLQEKNLAQVEKAKNQFIEALKNAFELIDKNDVEIGSASVECLNEMIARIHSGDLFQHFGPFKDGSSVNSPPSQGYHEDVVSLLETLLKRIGASRQKKTFERWSDHFESYWTCVKEENFALNFKNVKHITDFLYFEKKIANVKQLADQAIRKHRETFATQIKEQIRKSIEENRKIETETMKKEMMELIEDSFSIIPHVCPDDCQFCREYKSHYSNLLQEIAGTEWAEETKRSLAKYNADLHERSKNMLRQTFDGSAVKQGCFSDFTRTIADELNKALEKRPDGIYSSSEQASITANIWELLQGIAKSKDSRLDPKARFNKALIDEYAVIGVLPNILQKFEIETCDNLFKMNAFKHVYDVLGFKKLSGFIYRPLTEDLKDALSHAVDDIITNICKSRGGEEYLKSGLDFEEGMVRQIRIEFPVRIKAFEKKFSIHLKDEFKMDLQIYALQQFYNKMIKLQATWNKHNSPIEILMEKRNDYTADIETRLKSGFSSACAGEIFAKQLCTAIKNKAMEYAYAEHVSKVLSLEWTTNSEKVRLLYFEELAKEIQTGNKEKALYFFRNPKNAIEIWYNKQVNSSISRENLVEIYDSTILSELNSVQTKLTKSTCKEDIDNIMKSLVSVEDQYFIKLDQKYDDFATFKSSIDNQLNDHLRRYLNIKTKVKRNQIKLTKATCKEDLDKIQNKLIDVKDRFFGKIDLNSEEYEALITRTKNILRQHLDKPDDNDKLDPKIYFGAMKKSIDKEICLYLDLISNINFPLPSDDNSVKRRLGCTEHCYWCGALCWGARDHQVEKEKTSEMERHHSCHQPSGLNGSKDPDSEELCAVSCHNYLDTARVWFKEFKEGEGMLWSDAKRDHFPDWKFDAHCITTFDEMMRWFFQELHEDIAKRQGSKPAGKKELQKNKCENLNLEEILKVVHSKI